RGTMALEAASYFASRYYSAIDDIEEINQTIRWITHQETVPNYLLDNIGSLVIHFAQHSFWSKGNNRLPKSTASDFTCLLNARTFLAGKRKDFTWVEELSKISKKICMAYGDTQAAEHISNE